MARQAVKAAVHAFCATTMGTTTARKAPSAKVRTGIMNATGRVSSSSQVKRFATHAQRRQDLGRERVGEAVHRALQVHPRLGAGLQGGGLRAGEDLAVLLELHVDGVNRLGRGGVPRAIYEAPQPRS